MFKEYPKMLYKLNGPLEVDGKFFDYVIVNSSEDEEAKSKEGWKKSKDELLPKKSDCSSSQEPVVEEPVVEEPVVEEPVVEEPVVEEPVVEEPVVEEPVVEEPVVVIRKNKRNRKKDRE